MIEVNCFKSIGAPFKDFQVGKLLVAGNTKDIYAAIHALSLGGVADCELRGGELFVRGSIQGVEDSLRSAGIAVLAEPEPGILNPADPRDANIIRAIFYRALTRYAHNRGFTVFKRTRRGRKRLIPRLDDLENLEGEGLASKLTEKMAVVRGLYFLLDVYGNGEALLWVDVYSPIVDLERGIPLGPKEAKRLGLRERYTEFIPQSSERYDLLQRLLKKLFSDKLGVTLADGFCIEFEQTPLSLTRVPYYV